MRNKFLIALSIIVAIFIIFCLSIIIYIQYGDGIRSLIPELDYSDTIKETNESIIQTEIQIEPETIAVIEEKELTTSMTQYTGYDNRVNIEYPIISGMDDENLQESINKKIYNNAISIVQLYPISTKMQTLNISSKINHLDDKKIVIIYEGKVEGYTVKQGTSNSSKGSGSGLVGSGALSDNPSNNYQTSQGIDLYSQGLGQNFNFPNNVDSNAPVNPFGVNIYPGGTINGFSNTITVDQKIFYTNTIDLETGKDISLNDVAAPSVLAKYARTSKAEIINVDDNDLSAVRKYIRKSTISSLTETLKNADFKNAKMKSWPKSFSYTDEEYIYFTVRLSTKLGNYAIVKYPLDKK